MLDPLEPALYERRPFAGRGLVCHSDRGSHYVSVRYTERLTEAAIELSVGSVGNSYDNALAETIIGLFRTEVIHRRSPWRSLKAVEFATLERVDWFNTRRRHLGGCLGIPDSATVPPPPDLVRHLATACPPGDLAQIRG